MDYEVSKDGYPILDQLSEEGFVDCVLKVTARIDRAAHYELMLQASHAGMPIGFRALVTKDICGGFDEQMNLIAEHVYSSGVEFIRTGPESDNLVAAIAELYDLAEEAPLRMVERISFTAIALHQRSEVNLEAEPVGLKLFGYDTEDDPSDRYFESFFNLDLANGFVFWNEKDPEYRLPLLRGIADVDADSVARLRCFGRG